MQPAPSILTGKIPWTEEPDRLQSMGLQEFDITERLSTHTHTHTHTLPSLAEVSAGSGFDRGLRPKRV